MRVSVSSSRPTWAGIFYAMGSAPDAAAKGQYPDFESPSQGRLAYAIEIGRDGTLFGHSSAVKLTYTTAPDRDGFAGGESWSVLAHQDVRGTPTSKST